jgi:hypothetical protein
MRLGQTRKREFKMKSTCTTKKRGRLVQVKWKWCNGLNRDNLKHKLYMTRKFWEEAPLSSLLYILCMSMGSTSKCHFSPRLPSGSPIIGILVVPKFWIFIFFSNQVCFESARKISYVPSKYLFNDA